MQKQPLIFLGHGSPMNAIESNQYTESWKKLGESLNRPRAILMLSAHWITPWETRIATNSQPGMIYDMGGFPPELYRVRYNAPGSLEMAREIKNTIEGASDLRITEDSNRWFDHGVWSTLMHLFPAADIPVICMSLDYTATPEKLFHLGEVLAILREQGILIVASGNIVHNLGAIDWSGNHIYPWALEFDARVAKGIQSGKNSTECMDILQFQTWWDVSRLAHPSYDHFIPLFPLLGAANLSDVVTFLTPDIVMGSLSMRSIVWR